MKRNILLAVGCALFTFSPCSGHVSAQTSDAPDANTTEVVDQQAVLNAQAIVAGSATAEAEVVAAELAPAATDTTEVQADNPDNAESHSPDQGAIDDDPRRARGRQGEGRRGPGTGDWERPRRPGGEVPDDGRDGDRSGPPRGGRGPRPEMGRGDGPQGWGGPGRRGDDDRPADFDRPNRNRPDSDRPNRDRADSDRPRNRRPGGPGGFGRDGGQGPLGPDARWGPGARTRGEFGGPRPGRPFPGGPAMGRPAGGGGPGHRAEMQALRAEIQQLREAVQALTQQLKSQTQSTVTY